MASTRPPSAAGVAPAASVVATVNGKSAPEYLQEICSCIEILVQLSKKQEGEYRFAVWDRTVCRLDAVRKVIPEFVDQATAARRTKQEAEEYFDACLNPAEVKVKSQRPVNGQYWARLDQYNFDLGNIISNKMSAEKSKQYRTDLSKRLADIKHVLAKRQADGELDELEIQLRDKKYESIGRKLQILSVDDFYDELCSLSGQLAEIELDAQNVDGVDQNITIIMTRVQQIEETVRKLPKKPESDADFNGMTTEKAEKLITTIAEIRKEAAELERQLEEMPAYRGTSAFTIRSVTKQIQNVIVILENLNLVLANRYLKANNPQRFAELQDNFVQCKRRLEQINCNITGVLQDDFDRLEALNSSAQLKAKIQKKIDQQATWIRACGHDVAELATQMQKHGVTAAAKLRTCGHNAKELWMQVRADGVTATARRAYTAAQTKLAPLAPYAGYAKGTALVGAGIVLARMFP